MYEEMTNEARLYIFYSYACEQWMLQWNIEGAKVRLSLYLLHKIVTAQTRTYILT